MGAGWMCSAREQVRRKTNPHQRRGGEGTAGMLDRQLPAAICLEGGKALILQRGPTAPWMPNRWNLPGGGIDGGESAEQAAVRETQEEAGLTLQAPRLLGELEYVDGRLLAVFVADHFTGDLKINWESSAYEWVNESQLAGFDFVPPIEQALRMAFASLTQ